MQDYKREFIEFCLAEKVLSFGEFTLKSGRISPYFFNAGLFNSGAALAALGRFYARAIVDAGVSFDMLFGPAYKGIPLAAATAIALADVHGRDVPWCFNRKEAKDHGEGGTLVGAPLSGRVLIVDDVITAGTAIRESVAIMDSADAELAGVMISMDRQEKGSGTRSAIQEVENTYSARVINVISLADLVGYLQGKAGMESDLAAIERYRETYGVCSA